MSVVPDGSGVRICFGCQRPMRRVGAEIRGEVVCEECRWRFADSEGL